MQTRIFIVERGAKLGVFGDPIATVPIGNRTLAETQIEAAQRAGLEITRVTSANDLPVPCFVMSEDTFVTPRFLESFVSHALTLGTNSRAGLAAGECLERIAIGHPTAEKSTDGFLFDLWYRATDVGVAGSVFTPIVIECDDLAYSRSRVPTALSEAREIQLFESSLAILQVRDPLHLYQANMHQLVWAIRELLTGVAPSLGVESVGAGFEGASPLTSKRFRSPRGNALGEGVDIHPTAFVEGSVLGDGASIGAHAVVRHALIDRGAQVSEQSFVQRSVVGENALIHAQCRVLHSVVCADAFLSHSPFQFSFLGRGAAVFGTLPTDFRLDGRTVRTLIDDEVRDSGVDFLGLLVGHHAKVAAGVVSKPGRVIANGLVVHRETCLAPPG
ncbi:MAG: hypothetical protein H6729_17565 [Deltaproteobacteria bacterium]|nr:hypothetical protein [Deltaproteobacteria bacterium]